MARVDPDDDSTEQFVTRRYTFVPSRRQHRWVTVAAFDSRRECSAHADTLARNLTALDHLERVEEFHLEAGHHHMAQNGRLLRHAIQRRANLGNATWDR